MDRESKIRCYDCQWLDIGVNNETDAWVHCSIKHATDIAHQIYRKQPKITKEIANENIFCDHFKKKQDRNDIFQLAKEMGIE